LLITKILPWRRTTTESARFFNERNELRTFISQASCLADQGLNTIGEPAIPPVQDGRTRLVAPLIGMLGISVAGLAAAPPLWAVGALLAACLVTALFWWRRSPV
jgi:hypothetical protein